MMDNGAAMKAGETRQGLLDLGIQLVEIPDYTPEHNAIVEAFWKQIVLRLLPMLESVRDLTLQLLNEATLVLRLLPMLESVRDLTLQLLNEVTLAFLEFEYNRTVHSETGQAPTARALQGPSVVRDSPTADEIRRAFRLKVDRRQRASDGTISVAGKRFEVPSCYRHLDRLTVRYARWDLFAAEDALTTVRARLDGICAATDLRLAELDLQVITAPTLRLDLELDRDRLEDTVRALRPMRLILDPFVRLHRIDENVSADVAPRCIEEGIQRSRIRARKCPAEGEIGVEFRSSRVGPQFQHGRRLSAFRVDL